MAKDKLDAFKRDELIEEQSLSLNQKLKIIDKDITEKKQEKENIVAKKNNQKQINFRILESDFDKYNKLFGSKGISFSRAIRMWLDFGYYNVVSGNLDISEAGIREVPLSKLRE